MKEKQESYNKLALPNLQKMKRNVNDFINELFVFKTVVDVNRSQNVQIKKLTGKKHNWKRKEKVEEKTKITLNLVTCLLTNRNGKKV